MALALVRIAGGGLIVLLALSLTVIGLGAVGGFLAAAAVSIAVNAGQTDEAFLLFWGMDHELFMTLLYVGVGSIVFAVSDAGLLTLLGNLLGGAALGLFGLSLAGFMNLAVGQAVLGVLGQISFLAFLPAVLLALFFLLFFL